MSTRARGTCCVMLPHCQDVQALGEEQKTGLCRGLCTQQLSITSPTIRPSGQMVKRDPFSLHTRIYRMAGGRDEVGGQVPYAIH